MSLNPQQLLAVQHQQGPLLILAGAGTGKTRVLVNRIAHLVQECGVAPGRILAVTFTNKAAGEMKRRVEELVGGRARELWVGTFHSTCVKILRRHALEAGIAPEFVIYDGADQLNVVKQVLRELNLDEKKLPPTSLVSRISRLKDQLKTPADFQGEAGNPFQKTLAKVYEAYEKILGNNHALDFGDLIFKTVLLFEKHSAILSGYQGLWQYLLIDEYQDTNHAQYRFATLLAAKHKNLSVVGDPDQSIYRWRGADLNNILNFEKDYPEAKVIRLEQNYRSVQNVLTAANHVIANNELRKEKTLWSALPAGEKIVFAALNSEKEEALFVIEKLRGLHTAKKIPYSQMAVFYRTNAQSRALEEILRLSGIPYIIYGGVRFYERAEVKDALAYLKIFHQPGDGVSFKRILNVPARGIGGTTVEKILAIAAAQGLSFYEAAKTVCDHAKLSAFLNWFETLRAQKNSLTPVELFQKILETSGYMQNLLGQSSTEAQDRVANLNELMASLADFSATALEPTLGAYLERVALITDLDQAAEGGVLSLMTLHLAKGLEFRTVAIVGMEEGLLPHSRSQDEIEELEEERRLFYVGMTRAKERLFLTQAWRRYLNGQEQYGLPSRFLEEIPEELIEKIEPASRGDDWDFDQRGEEDRSPLRGRKAETIPQPSGLLRAGALAVTNFARNDKVRHPDFGIGTVSASEKTSLGEKVTVKFTNGSIKKLIAEYARLEKI